MYSSQAVAELKVCCSGMRIPIVYHSIRVILMYIYIYIYIYLFIFISRNRMMVGDVYGRHAQRL